MRILVDENVPAPVVGMLRTLLPGHEVQSVRDIKWTGRDDAAVLAAATDKGFDAFLTRDNRQLDDAAEHAAIRRSGMHHIRYRQDGRGRAGLGLAMGAVIAAMTRVADELARAGGQRLIHIKGPTPDTAHYDTVDPTRKPPRPPKPPTAPLKTAPRPAKTSTAPPKTSTRPRKAPTPRVKAATGPPKTSPVPRKAPTVRGKTSSTPPKTSPAPPTTPPAAPRRPRR
ncbi:DUF5615 family PIN-like protein [Streptantibioticus silvisoli]|jgi:hypothetical protein|uniref:DUF5615 family PIN-like protein n=1 Tax=Streptantibioticus silvisoli TaxID=2705255 RepID=A0ABT6VWI5_9ACTN|nr:DUF5615 family PIN-like protein [Streptantibioticus silvisoli]MDI5962842.1 DUF5615 family PIN-like protein [Streptantibioticus silvisoli]